jgi:predicted RNase H-like HicB family nuclease
VSVYRGLRRRRRSARPGAPAGYGWGDALLVDGDNYHQGEVMAKITRKGRGVDRTITLTASLTPEEGGYVARCVELPVVSEGDTAAEALAMLQEAVELYLEDEPLPNVAVRLTIAGDPS